LLRVLGEGLINALLAIGIVSIPAYARVARASVLQVKELGFRHGRPRSRRPAKPHPDAEHPPAHVDAADRAGTLGIATAILDAAALSFLGLGAQPPMAEWGSMLGAERNQVFTAPHLVFFPGMMIMVTVLAFNLLGDGLRDALDPRLRK
jgi:peptide/nickel transport system permease protein